MSEASSHVPAMFGSMVFNEKVMKERLPKDTYKALKNARMKGFLWICLWLPSWPMP